MAELYKLCNHIKPYDWGSPDDIPRLMGFAGDGRPCAELWMGSHPISPSRICLPDGEIGLGELIARDPCRYLGAPTAEHYGELPFLFKLLAAEKPLSVQAHPNLAQAREGFDRENRAGLAPDAPHRSYRDSNHKPEIICALTPFTGMCGFRRPSEIRQLLLAFLGPAHKQHGEAVWVDKAASYSPGKTTGGSNSASAVIREGFAPLLQALETPASDAAGLRNFLDALFALSPAVRSALTAYILSANGARGDEWELIQHFARLHPGDPAVIAPLYLNVFRLEPGEALFLQAGVLHAYIRGFGVELMANSDNVLRGGLTAKHIDVPELMRVLDFAPFSLQVIKPEPGFSRFTYPVPCEEFSLTVMHHSGGTAVLPMDLAQSPAICIVTEGEVVFSGAMTLKQGESAFIPPAANGESPLELQGNYTLYIASVPQ